MSADLRAFLFCRRRRISRSSRRHRTQDRPRAASHRAGDLAMDHRPAETRSTRSDHCPYSQASVSRIRRTGLGTIQAQVRLAMTTRCDECGKTPATIHRVHHGHRYCNTCYAREFRPLSCPRCGESARLPRRNPEAICRRCEKSRPCVRCGKIEYAIGKMTPYGPACNACSPYFRESTPCDFCGALSSRRSRVTRQRHTYRLCPRCARADHATCNTCRRYRPLLLADDGHKLCAACLEHGNIPCPTCAKPMPAGYGSQCSECYWRRLLAKRVETNCAALSAPAMVDYFENFAAWLTARVGTHKAAITVNRYLELFANMDRRWQAIPSYGDLLAQYGAAGLRRVQLPIVWMEEAELIQVDTQKKSDESERRRIATALKTFNTNTLRHSVLHGYYRRLERKRIAGRTTLKSIRLNLTPAVALLQHKSNTPDALPNQRTLEVYLISKPGQGAAVAGFVRHLREKHDLPLRLPALSPNAAGKRRQKVLENELLAMMRSPDAYPRLELAWISCALAYFHGLPKGVAQAAKLSQFVSATGTVCLICDNQQYWIPKPPAQKFSGLNDETD